MNHIYVHISKILRAFQNYYEKTRICAVPRGTTTDFHGNQSTPKEHAQKSSHL